MKDIYTPASLAALWSVRDQCGGDGIMVAGGTDLLIEASRHINPRESLIDLSGLDELKGICEKNNSIYIGALETMSAVAANDLVIRRATCLAQAAGRVGSWQIRNRATLGGNLANTSPAADTPSAMAALEAEVILASPSGHRNVPVESIPSGPGQNSLRPGEIIVAFRLPISERLFSAFSKIGSRSEVSIARLNLAVAVSGGKSRTNNSFEKARVFMGTLGLALRRCPSAEKLLIESGLTRWKDFGQALAETIAEAIPGRSTLPYKSSAVMALAQDVLEDLGRKVEE